MFSRLCFFAALATPAPVLANTFIVEILAEDGSQVASLNDADPLFSVDHYAADGFQIQGELVILRWAGTFSDPAATTNDALDPDGTYLFFDSERAGTLLCRPAEEGTENTWQRDTFAEDTASGLFSFDLVVCFDETGEIQEVDGLPFRVQGSYVLSPDAP